MDFDSLSISKNNVQNNSYSAGYNSINNSTTNNNAEIKVSEKTLTSAL